MFELVRFVSEMKDNSDAKIKIDSYYQLDIMSYRTTFSNSYIRISNPDNHLDFIFVIRIDEEGILISNRTDRIYVSELRNKIQDYDDTELLLLLGKKYSDEFILEKLSDINLSKEELFKTIKENINK